MAKKLKLYSQKIDNQPFSFDQHNQRNFKAFEAQAPAGCYTVEYNRVPKAKTNEQLERGENILAYKTFRDKQVPVMTNKDNLDALLKELYMVSIGQPEVKFSKGKSSTKRMSELIEWTLDYLATELQIYVPSSDEYKRIF